VNFDTGTASGGVGHPLHVGILRPRVSVVSHQWTARGYVSSIGSGQDDANRSPTDA
jgi:hypothetical protein